MEAIRSHSELESLRSQINARRDPERRMVSVCTGTGCKAYKCDELVERLREEIQKAGLDAQIDTKPTGCPGFCERGTLVVIYPQKIFYQQVRPEHAADIVQKTLVRGELVEELLYLDEATGKRVVTEDEVPFYQKQQQLLLGPNRLIDPTSLDDYLALGGYRALSKALATLTPDAVIDLITKSGLRGRGGGGFPAGVKWRSCRDAPGEKHYVICNADEGDPGAFMDRCLLEANPHSVLEGMLIGAYAIGATEGYIYVRNEYPLAVQNAGLAVAEARRRGLLGEGILGTGFSFDVKVSRGGGAFVCGESTALMASLEGYVGEPRAKYVHTVEHGLNNQPTNLNNVETWANVPLILERGVEWYTGIGTGDVSKSPWGGSKGTKIFSLVGKVRNTGLVEVPMGITLRQIVFDIGGGVPAGRAFKAVQTGGPSGGCLPEALLDQPVDFDVLAEAGSMMGSGGMIVMDDRTCMVDIARYFTKFLVDESCGKCVPCREGNRRMLEILDRICRGEGTLSDLPLMERLAQGMTRGSLCALGTTSPNPVLSTLRYFRDEYLAHIEGRRCPAAVCRSLITYTINAQCNGCTLCARVCPQQAITGVKKQPHLIDQAKCDRCGVCIQSCKFDAIDVA